MFKFLFFLGKLVADHRRIEAKIHKTDLLTFSSEFKYIHKN